MTKKNYKPFPETEDLLWSECIRMQEDVVEARKTRYYSKYDWLEDNNYDSNDLILSCFFCTVVECECAKCPARLIDSEFDCMCKEYDYAMYDGKFVTKLKELNAIRKRITV
jgi:hypothetical protein